ncbi:MAG: PHP domain-containing protein [Candidatus Omnitrophica bacterium]|nr:PHP domain-containing protein [Candidatus Omnitrophota bacterium]
MSFADLHLHTRFSDGTYTPDELTAEARRLDLAALALTDHDTVEGCAPMAIACQAADIEFFSGTELTAELDGHELHFLGYFIDIHNQNLLSKIATFQVVRQNRVREMVARLNHLNIPLEASAVFALANCRSPGRPHVGRALVQAGFCANLDEAFDRFLKRHRPAWVPKFKMSAFEAIELIHRAGGLAVLAHPGLNRYDQAIPELAEAGLDGLECFHSKHSPENSQHYLRLAHECRLLVTGGSDCHGMSKGRPTIGSVRLPFHYVLSLKARAMELNPTPPAVAGPPQSP